MSEKPHLRIIAGRPVTVDRRESAIEAARRRFGRPFAHEPGSDWKPRQQPLLIEWLASRQKKEPKD